MAGSPGRNPGVPAETPTYCFVTSNHTDFSTPNGDRSRTPIWRTFSRMTTRTTDTGWKDSMSCSPHALANAFLLERDAVGALADSDEPRTHAEIIHAVWYVRRVPHSENENGELPGTRSEVRPRRAMEANRTSLTGTIMLTFIPSATKGTVVRGFIGVDTFNS